MDRYFVRKRVPVKETFFLKEETLFSVMIGRSNHRKKKQKLKVARLGYE